ncbi:hypothetical protein U8326_02215 [Tsuneonella sp. CC-YZS046]|uniref:hypothetical protein n=1 Tax=Tsuneonella sp. CC-YZS046 TaxID=3042152 RepID=UPI002D79C3B4|nr:hypothetical protein [Tsuneonella sp. CC-YZS046]WRO67008.1 hypothetical protein U8326_02215 [Tsuneonella sp. CC-YZS046]
MTMQTAWEAAVAAEKFARSTMEQYRAEILVPADKAYAEGRATFQHLSGAEEGWEPYTSALADALDAMILTPAPTLADVVFKLERGLADGAFDGRGDTNRKIRVVVEDVRRLGINQFAASKTEAASVTEGWPLFSNCDDDTPPEGDAA